MTIDDNVGHRVFDADPAEWDSDLAPSGGGWFSLSVGFDVAGTRYDLLPILAGLLENEFLEETLGRLESGYVYAPLPNGDALRLPIGRVRRILQHLESLIDPKFPHRTRLHLLDAAALANLNELGITPPPDLTELAVRLRDFAGIEAVEPPAGVLATLRDYQLAGFRWMQFLARHGLHGILADDMGLGKTLQTLTHVLAEKRSGASGGLPALVVAPTSVVPNWRAEAHRFTPDLRVLDLTDGNTIAPSRMPTWFSHPTRCSTATSSNCEPITIIWSCSTRHKTSRTRMPRSPRPRASSTPASAYVYQERRWKTIWASYGV